MHREMVDKDGFPLDEMPMGTGTIRGHVTKLLTPAEAKARPNYKETVANEMGRFFQFASWGKPVPRFSVDPGARIHRCKMIYSVKHAEMDEIFQRDKARFIVQGCLRFTRDGKVRLERWYKTPGQYWAPVGSLAGLRVVSAFGVIQDIQNETIDLDSGYMQTEHELRD